MNQDTLIVQRGECLRARIDYANEDTTAIDLTGKELSCPEASHAILQEGIEFEFIDASKGSANVYVPSTIMAALPAGRSSWFRIGIPVDDEEDPCLSISMKVWVDIQ